MINIFNEILEMSFDAAWLIGAVIIARALLYKAPKYFHKVLWGLVGLRLCIPFSFESVLSLIPHKVPETVDKVASQVVTATEANSLSKLDILAIVWVVVAVALLVYGIVSYIKLRARIFDGVIYKENIYLCEKIESPFVCGFFKPKIYLPYGLNEETENCVLQHEKTHIKHGDHILKYLGFAILCVHWFNPLVWISYFLLCKDIELSCDESVVKHYDAEGCKKYAKALLTLGVNKVKLSACPVAFGEVGIKKRIKSVINYKKAGKFLVFVSLGLCMAVVLCFMTDPKVELKEKNVSEEVVQEDVTDEPVIPETEAETTEEATTEPTTENIPQNTVTQDQKSVETTEEVFDDSMFENEDDGIESDPLNKINIQDPDLIEVPGATSIYEGVTYNNYGSNSSVIGNKPSNTVELPTVSFPADPTPTAYNYHHTRPYNQFDPNGQFYMW